MIHLVSELISINRTSGKIYIEPIDRDTLKIDVYPFLVSILYKPLNYKT